MSTGFGNNPAPISFIFRSEVDTMARDFTRVTPMPKSEARNKLKDYTLTLLSNEVEGLKGEMKKPYNQHVGNDTERAYEFGINNGYNSALQSQIDFLLAEIKIIKSWK